MLDSNFEYLYWKWKQIKTQKKVWLMLKEMIYNKELFKKKWIDQIWIHFKISKQSLVKYFWDFKIKYKNNRDKRIFFKNRVEYQFIKDLEKIRLKYNWLLEKKMVERWQYYLLNLM